MLWSVPLPGGQVVFSSRVGGVSEGPFESLNLGILTDDDPDRVRENRSILAASCGLEPGAVAMGWQVHGVDLQEWGAPPANGSYEDPSVDAEKVDGHVTSVPGLGLLVLVADCLPVALVAPGRVAMVHCGWRGLAGGILEAALARFDTVPAAAIGPGIGKCHYEVGPEVLDAFSDLEGVADGRMLDLAAVATRQLEARGVTQIENVGVCTYCEPQLLFSHRRDDGVTGRQGGIAWLTG